MFWFLIEAVSGDDLLVRRALDADRKTGRRRWNLARPYS
jgi:hypothetical protein